MNQITHPDRSSPWSSFRNEMWDLFDRFSRDLDYRSSSTEEEFSPHIEVQEEKDHYLIKAEIPGVEEKDIKAHLQGSNLVIEGEKLREEKKSGFYHSEISYGRFLRSIPLGDDVETDDVSAFIRNGVLEIRLKKRKVTKEKDKSIEIKIKGNEPEEDSNLLYGEE
jgi:HSP20 family protein